MMLASRFDSTSAAEKCAPAQIRDLAQFSAVALKLEKRRSLPPGAAPRSDCACCPIP
jgi:hypothetical protein